MGQWINREVERNKSLLIPHFPLLSNSDLCRIWVHFSLSHLVPVPCTCPHRSKGHFTTVTGPQEGLSPGIKHCTALTALPLVPRRDFPFCFVDCRHILRAWPRYSTIFTLMVRERRDLCASLVQVEHTRQYLRPIDSEAWCGSA
jgi:hypothetical protein